jgi:hypothetical protein
VVTSIYTRGKKEAITNQGPEDDNTVITVDCFMSPKPLLVAGAVLLMCFSGLIYLHSTKETPYLTPTQRTHKINNRSPVYLASVPSGWGDTSKCANSKK